MSISRRRCLTIVVSNVALLAVFAIARHARAEDSAGAPAKESGAARTTSRADEVREWVKDLDSDIFVARQDAGRRLFDAGKEAIAPLAEATNGKSLEVTSAAVDILRRLSQSAEPTTRDAAKGALDKISQGINPTAAGLAKDALAPPPSANPQPGAQNFGGNIQLGGNIQVGGGIQFIGPAGVRKIRIAQGGNIKMVPGGAIQVFQIQANANNGNRTVDVDDNGKKVHIQEDQNGLEIRVTEKVNGQDKSDTFKAKNAAELKQKYPEANKLYEKYGQNHVGGIQIQAQAQAIGQAVPLPIIVPAVPLIPAAPIADKPAAAPNANGK